MKKILAVLIVIITIIFAISSVNPTIIYANNDGYLLSSNYDLFDSMDNKESYLPLVSVAQSDEIYQSMGSTYINGTGEKVDMSYPMYMNNGATLKFLSDDFYIMTENFRITTSYEALYVTNGNAYNEDYTLADGERYYFVVLDNGLYMNTLEVTFETIKTSVVIPVNSIIQFSEEGIQYYEYKNNELQYNEVVGSYNATITIDDITYDYSEFLIYIGLVRATSVSPELPQETLEPSSGSGEGSTGSTTDIKSDIVEYNPTDEYYYITSIYDVDYAAGSSGSGSGGGSGGSSGSGSDEIVDNEGDFGTAESDPAAPTYDPPTFHLENFESWSYALKADLYINDFSGVLSRGITMTVYKTLNEPSADEDEVVVVDADSDDEETSSIYYINKVTGEIVSTSSDDTITVYPSDLYSGSSSVLKQVFTSSEQMMTLSTLEPGYTYYLQYNYIYTSKVTENEGTDEETSYLTRLSGISDIYEMSTTLRNTDEMSVIDLQFEDVFAAFSDKYYLQDLDLVNYIEYSLIDKSGVGYIYVDNNGDIVGYDADSDGVMDEVIEEDTDDTTDETTDGTTDGTTDETTDETTTDETTDEGDIEEEEEPEEETNVYELNFSNSFDDFKLNSLSYLYTLKVKLVNQADSNDVVEHTVYNSTISKVLAQTTTTYTSTSITLDSNAVYDCTMTGYDKYGVELPVTMNGTVSGDSFYTSKDTPVATMSEGTNSDGLLEIYISLEDIDDALVEGSPLRLMVYDSAGASQSIVEGTIYKKNSDGEYVLYGEYVEGEFVDLSEITYDTGSYAYETNTMIIDYNPQGGDEYMLSLTSMPFAKRYEFRIIGDYDSAPDQSPTGYTSVSENVVFGTKSFYVGALTSGNLYYERSSTAVVYDTYGEFVYQMTKDSSTEVTGLVDYVTISIKDSLGNVVATQVLSKSVLSQMKLSDLEESDGWYTLPINRDTDSGLTLQIYCGTETLGYATSVWDVLFVQSIPGDDGSDAYLITASYIKILVDEFALNTKSTYYVNIQNTVIKGGIEYSIPTYLDTSAFSTKYLSPVISTYDVFTANDFISIVDLAVYDKDETIQNSGLYQVQVCVDNIALYSENLYAYQIEAPVDGLLIPAPDDTEVVYFSGLVPGMEYEVRIVAVSYNNDTGFANKVDNYIMDSFTVVVGSDITADFSINNLGSDYQEGEHVTNMIDINDEDYGAIPYYFTLESTYPEVIAEQKALIVNDNKVTISGDYIKAAYEDSLAGANGRSSSAWYKWYIASTTYYNSYYTEMFDISSLLSEDSSMTNIFKLEVSSTSTTLGGQNNGIYCYDENFNQLTSRNQSRVYGEIVDVVPAGTKYIRFVVSDYDILIDEGISFSVYSIDTESANLVRSETSSTASIGSEYMLYNSIVSSSNITSTNGSYKTVYNLPVTAGEQFFLDASSDGSYLTFTDINGNITACMYSFYRAVSYTVPEDSAYMSFYIAEGTDASIVKIVEAEPIDPIQYNQVINTNDVGVLSEYIKTTETSQYYLGANSENTISSNYIENAIEESENGTRADEYAWSVFGTTYTSEMFDISSLKYPNDLTYSILEMQFGTAETSSISLSTAITFYKENPDEESEEKYIEVSTLTPQYTGNGVGGYIPADATHMTITSTSSLFATGVNFYIYHIDSGYVVADMDSNTTYIKEDYTINNSTGDTESAEGYTAVVKIPVEAGEKYYKTTFLANGEDSSASGITIYNYDETGSLVSRNETLYSSVIYTVPEGVSYISYSVQAGSEQTLYKVFDVSRQYNINIDIEINDKKGYLFDEDGNSTTQLVVEMSDYINEVEYSVVESKTIDIELVETYDEDGTFVGYSTYIDSFNLYLERDKAYKVSIQGLFEGESIYIETLEFNSDASYRVIETDYDFYQMRVASTDNYLVMEDITITSQNWSIFYGIIDFGGHVLTHTNTSYLFHTLGGGTIRNMVYDIDTSTKTYGLVYTNYGTIEDVIIRTTGDVTLNTYGSLICYNNHGTIQDFIVQLNGDIYMGNSDYQGIISVYMQRNATLQNGYIYTSTGKGVIFTGDNTYNNSAGLVYIGYSGADISNVYAIYNTYNASDKSSVALFGTINDTVNGVYYVGENYVYDEEYSVKTTTLQSTRLIMTTSLYGNLDNIWHITENTYSSAEAVDVIQTAKYTTLSDPTWQYSVLGDAFDIDNTVDIGFYPRLVLPSTMQKYQSYISLPTVITSSLPELVNDSFVSETSNVDSTIKLLISGASGYTIGEVVIDGLTTTVLSYEYPSSNTMEVTLKVTMDETYADSVGYLSEYNLSRIVYLKGNTSVTVVENYTTTSFEMYKLISTAEEWGAINSNMYWNYRLASDIDFSKAGLSTAKMMINGSTSSTTSTSTFYGKIDGDGHTISGMTIEDEARVFIIYNMGTGSELKNLFIEDLTLHASDAQSLAYIGFIRYGTYGCVVDNVHVNNVSIIGSGYIGGLSGYFRGHASNSSVSNLYMEHQNANYTLYMGGMFGQTNYATCQNCYTYNIEMHADNVLSVIGIGGFVGYGYYSKFDNIYTHGTIDGTTSTIGGFAGYLYYESYNVISNIYTFVDITTTKDGVGGLVGSSRTYLENVLALGSIISDGSNTHRILGFYSGGSSGTSVIYPGYASSAQQVNDLEATDTDDARALLSAEELTSKKTWVDTLEFSSSNWDYEDLEGLYLPQLKNSNTGELLPNQEKIVAPGFENLQVSVDSVYMDSTKYIAAIDVSYAGLSGDEIQAMIEARVITYDIEGMLIGDDACIIDARDDYARLTITTTEFEQAFDMYKFQLYFYDYTSAEQSDGTIKYTAKSTLEDEAYCMINYGEPLYHTIDSLAQWNTLMKDHGTTSENFKITSSIDFATESSGLSYTNLMLGRVVGDGLNITISNVTFTSTLDKTGMWILSAKEISNLNFEYMTLNHLTLYEATVSFINAVSSGVSNVNISNVAITTKNSVASYIGFFGAIKGNVDNVEISDVTVVSTSSSTSTRGYTGSLAGTVNGAVTNVTASNINIDAALHDNVGGVVGYVNKLDLTEIKINENISATNVTVSGRQYVGGVIGRSDTYQYQNISIDDFSVTGVYTVGGIFGYNLQKTSTYTNSAFYASNGSVTSTISSTSAYYTGGIAGYIHGYGQLSDVKVDNVDVLGSSITGGAFGYKGYMNVIGIEITNSTVESLGLSYSSPAVGGVMGYTNYSYEIRDAVVKNTSIKGTWATGGICGYGTARVIVRSSYIDDDVTIYSSGDNVGGILGYGYSFIIRSCAVGADIMSIGNNVGGVVGCIKWTDEDESYQYIRGVYVTGDIMGADNVGGVIGYHNENSSISSADLIHVILTGNMSGGPNISPFIGGSSANASFSATSSTVMLWNGMQVNGQNVQDVWSAADLKSQYSTSVYYIEYDDLLKASTYSTADIFAIDTSYLSEGLYMPYITEYLSTDGNSGIILSNTREDSDGNIIGISLPSVYESTLTSDLSVYASGVDTINIETVADEIEVTIGGVTSVYNFENGTVTTGSLSEGFEFASKFGETYNVVTLGYDYQSDIIVDGETFTSEDLASTVMIWRYAWYYFNDDGLYYSAGSTAINALADDVPVHMWQGYILTKSGKVYDVTLSNEPVLYQITTTDVDGDGYTINVSEDYVPYELGYMFGGSATPAYYYSNTVGNSTSVYYNFSVINGSYYAYRYYGLYGSGLPMYSAQNLSYDEYVLNSSSLYYVAIDESGDDRTIYNYGSAFESGDNSTSNVVEMSNNFSTYTRYVIFKYNTGYIAIFDFVNGSTLYTTVPVQTSFLAYSLASITNFFGGDGVTNVVEDSSYMDSAEMADSLNSVTSGNSMSLPTSATYSSSEGLVAVVDEEGTVTDKESDSKSDSTASDYSNGDAIILNGDAEFVEGEGVYLDGKLVYEIIDDQTASSDDDSDTSSEDTDNADNVDSQQENDDSNEENSDDESEESGSTSSGSSSGSSLGSSTSEESGDSSEVESDVKVNLALTEYGQSLTEGVYEVTYDAITKQYETTINRSYTSSTEETAYEKVLANAIEAKIASETGVSINDFVLTFNEKNGFAILAALILLSGAIVCVFVIKAKSKRKKDTND